ncbi:MAG: aldo/keto reductase [Candidatus Hydrogenedentota bacterium]
MSYRIGRRDLLKSLLATTAATGLGAFAGGRQWPAVAAQNATMPTRRLGKTDHDVCIYSLGGQSTLEQEGTREASLEIINHALDLGINYIDTAEAYGGGISETYIGEVMKDRRDEVFLATKTGDYSYDGALRSCEQSLERLQTDHVDLYQHHHVNRSEELDEIEEGAWRAFQRLQDEGVIRYKGITSHTPALLIEALERFDHDCMLIPLNAADMVVNGPEDMDEFLSKAEEKDVGVIAMKVVSRGGVLDRGLSMEQALTYTLSHRVDTAIVGITEPWQLDENVEIAQNFEMLSDEELAEIRELAEG